MPKETICTQKGSRCTCTCINSKLYLQYVHLVSHSDVIRCSFSTTAVFLVLGVKAPQTLKTAQKVLLLYLKFLFALLICFSVLSLSLCVVPQSSVSFEFFSSRRLMMMGSSFIAFFNFVPLKINQQERKCINTQRRRPSAGASKCALQFSVSSKILFSSSNSTVGTLLILKKQELALFILFYRYDVYKSFSPPPKCSCSRRSLLIATSSI